MCFRGVGIFVKIVCMSTVNKEARQKTRTELGMSVTEYSPENGKDGKSAKNLMIKYYTMYCRSVLYCSEIRHKLSVRAIYWNVPISDLGSF